MEPWDVVVVGAGAAGLMAAARAAERGRHTLLLEKNRRPGAKILISGGTRCNLTHACDRRGIIEAFGSQGAFLHSALSALGPAEIVALFEAEGVPTVTEPQTDKVFPASDRAQDVVGALVRRLERSGCTRAHEEPLMTLSHDGVLFRLATPARTLFAHNVVLTTGGQSYPGCGTTGDGYALAAGLGHPIVPPRPALVPLRTDAAWVTALRGITIADAGVRVVSAADAAPGTRRPAILAERRGALLFTHFGLSGPAVLDVSFAVSAHAHPETLVLVCDFLPALRADALAAELAQACTSAGKRHAASVISGWVPQRLGEAILARLRLPADRRAAELSKADRAAIVEGLKGLPIPITGTLGYKKAEITAGGVALGEVDSRSMQSKLVPGLYFAGELLDLDGPIGGYNFTAAFATGFLAGQSV